MAKKSIQVENPALQFISTANEEAPVEEVKGAAEFKGLKRGRKPSTEETKTKRLNLLMLPSVCDDITKIAAMKRLSTNELINNILQDYAKDNAELIEKYIEVFGEE